MNVLACGITFTEKEEKELVSMGLEIDYIESEKDSYISSPEKYEIIICNWLFVNHPISIFSNLKVIHLLSAGLDRVPLDYIEQKNIRLYNAGGVYSIPMAEFAVMSVLSIYKKYAAFQKNREQHIWEKIRDIEELSDKNVCIFGTGSVGTETAKKFSVFCGKISGVDINETEKPYFDKIYSVNDYKYAAENSDIIIAAMPLNEKTKHFFNNEVFSCFKKGSVFVNIARGGIVSETDLKEAVENGTVGYAVMDVQENEPLPPDNWMWNDERIIITPHNSFVSNLNKKRINSLIIKNLRAWRDNGGT